MIYDIHTKNKSFLKLSKILREKGVKNNKFMLELYDETLVGVDPNSPEVAKNAELQFKIYREICRNYWYFIREICLVPADGANVPYELNLGNCTLSYLKTKNKNMIMILPRQHGKTMGEAVYDVWLLNFATSNSNCIYLNKGKSDAIKNLKLWRDIRALLPKWLLDNYICDYKNDIDNQESKVVSKRNNTLKIVAPANDPDMAEKNGRGLTVSNIVFDEFAFMKYNDLTFLACLPAWKRAAENAKKHGTPYGITIITTPANLDNEAGKYCYDMIEKAAKWDITMFDFSDSELDSFIESNSQNNYVFVQYTYLELGRDDDWLRQMIRDCNGDLKKVKREILLEWPRSMDSSVFSEQQLENVYQFVHPPVSFLYILDKQFKIDFYETPDMNKNYILSCDVAGGLTRDNSVVNIIDPEDFRIVGDFLNNKIDTNDFMRVIKELMTVYFRNAILVIERNSYGLNIAQTLMKDPQVEPRMYRENKESMGEKKVKDGFVVRSKSATVIYGVDTNAVTRKQMIDLLPEIIDTEYDKFISPNIYHDLVTLEKKKNGKIEHASDGHDDSLMAYLIFRWAVFFGKCFRDKFGISPVPSRSNVKTVSSTDNFKKIESLINQMNMEMNITAMEALKEQESKMNLDENKQLDAFLRITNMNKD